MTSSATMTSRFLTRTGVVIILRSDVVTCLVPVMARTVGRIRMNLLLLKWVRMLVEWISEWTWLVMAMTIALFIVRLQALPTGPRLLRLTNRILIPTLACGSPDKTFETWAISLRWPNNLATELRAVRKCSRLWVVCVLAILMNREMHLSVSLCLLCNRLTDRLMSMCLLLEWTTRRLCIGVELMLVSIRVCSCWLRLLLIGLTILYRLRLSSYRLSCFSRWYRVGPIRMNLWCKLMIVTLAGVDLTVVWKCRLSLCSVLCVVRLIRTL